MGYYIDVIDDKPLVAKNKLQQILAAVPGAYEVSGKEFLPNLICVIENGPFDAAGWAFDAQEWKEFAYPDGRPRRWCVVPEIRPLLAPNGQRAYDLLRAKRE